MLVTDRRRFSEGCQTLEPVSRTRVGRMRLGQGDVGWQIERMRADHRALLRRNLELVTGLLDEALPDW